MLEERKKKRDEEDLLAALVSIKVNRRGKVTKIKEIDFASTSTNALKRPLIRGDLNVIQISVPGG